MDLCHIQALLGHSSSETTEICTPTANNTWKKLYCSLDFIDIDKSMNST